MGQTIRVQKYGGTSVGDPDRIQKVARRIQRHVEDGEKVVVVVSAMGRTTDSLIQKAREFMTRPSRRELDMLLTTGEQQSIAFLAMALRAIGVRARSLTGQQAGIFTSDYHGNARILRVEHARITELLQDFNVLVVAGFQGATEAGDLTTLGRGGSDTTAVALASALGVRECEIFTDTDGIYTTDPHLIPSAQKRVSIEYDDMIELAALGARVLEPRAVWFARRYGVVLHIRSAFNFEPGTIVADLETLKERNMLTDNPITGVALDLNHARVDLHRVPDTPGVAARIFAALGDAKVNVDMIIQGVKAVTASRQQMAFAIHKDDIETAVHTLKPLLAEDGGHVEVETEVAKLSIVGKAISSTPGLAAKFFEAVAAAGANIEMITTSEIRISVMIPAEHAEAALGSVHAAFGLAS